MSARRRGGLGGVGRRDKAGPERCERCGSSWLFSAGYFAPERYFVFVWLLAACLATCVTSRLSERAERGIISAELCRA